MHTLERHQLSSHHVVERVLDDMTRHDGSQVDEGAVWLGDRDLRPDADLIGGQIDTAMHHRARPTQHSTDAASRLDRDISDRRDGEVDPPGVGGPAVGDGDDSTDAEARRQPALPAISRQAP